MSDPTSGNVTSKPEPFVSLLSTALNIRELAGQTASLAIDQVNPLIGGVDVSDKEDKNEKSAPENWMSSMHECLEATRRDLGVIRRVLERLV